MSDLVRWWPATIDLFATCLNHRSSLNYSPIADPMSIWTDVMLHPWDSMAVYAVPPFGMVHQVLLKVRKSVHCTMTLLAPFWFSDLLNLLIEVPVLIPQRKAFLRQPRFHCFPRNLHMLRLSAQHISSDRPGISASLQQWFSSLPVANNI